MNELQNGSPFGLHRVVEPEGVFPQPAEKVSSDFSKIWDNEILISVETLNVDSASFTQIKNEAGGDKDKIAARIKEIVSARGKMHNPVTGSGGVLIGTVTHVGSKLDTKVKVGDKLVTLVSLSLTPLRLDEVNEVLVERDQVKVKGEAVLFETGIYAILPEDVPETLALAILDVCGAPAQTQRLVKQDDTVVIIGAGGKSGILCAYEAQKIAGSNGKVIGIEYSDEACKRIADLGFCDEVIQLDAQNAVECYEAVKKSTDGKFADVVINCVNLPNTEMASILMTKDEGTVYFFSMATSFTKAALGAEGVKKDVNMLVGNGYAKNHDEIALNILKESPVIKELYEKLYC